MAAGGDVDTEELKLIIKSSLISRSTVTKASALKRECEDELGKVFPFRKLGFSTFVDYLKSIPNVVQVQQPDSYDPDVLPVVTKASKHIDQLVSKQRAPPKRRGSSRRGAFNSRPPTRRPPTYHRSIREVPRLTPSVARPNQGIDVRDLESYLTKNYDKKDLSRNGIQSVDDLLSHADDMVERRDSKVYPKLAGASNEPDYSNKTNGIPAGLEDEFNDFDDDDCDEYFYEEGKDSEEEMSKKVIQLWEKALHVEENGSSSRSPVPVGEPQSGTSMEQNYIEEEDDESNISSGMINNFRKILDKNPNGIWASQLSQLYYDELHMTLDYLDLGYTSAIALASSLPRVFSYQREGSHDWKLYDARYITQESLDNQETTGPPSIENGRYVPQTIIDKIKRLLKENPQGFRSTDLLQLYQQTFRKPLDLEILGFNTVEEFLQILKDDITLKKATNYYILLPKHQIVSYEVLEPPNPEQRLNVPAEALGFPIPEDVMMKGEEIPLQELPRVQEDPDKPLMELEVRVAEVHSPTLFYMVLDRRYQELENMMDDLEKFYNWEHSAYEIPMPHLELNLYCATKYEGFWHRAKIIRIKGPGLVEIEFIDYGTPATVKSSELRYLTREFAHMPAQAICAKLMGVKPLNGATKFSAEVCKVFLDMVQGKRLVAHVYQVLSQVKNQQEKMQLDLILFDVEKRNPEIVINDYLIENGLASKLDFPDYQIQESPLENQLLAEGRAQLSDPITLQADGFTESVPTSSLPSVPGKSSLSLHENAPASLPGSSKTQEEKKPRVPPPPGFKESDLMNDFPTSLPNTAGSNSSQAEQSNRLFFEKQPNIFVNYYMMNSPELYPQLYLQEQCLPNIVFRPNPSNLPLAGAPLFRPPQPLVYGSFAPQPVNHNPHRSTYRQQGYQTVSPVSNNYIPMNAAVSYPVPMNMNPLPPTNYVLVPNPQYGGYQHVPSNVVGSMYSQAQGYPLRSSPVIFQPSPVLSNHSTHTPIKCSPASSPAPSYSPKTVPEWPPKVHPVSCTGSSTQLKSGTSSSETPPIPVIKAETPESNQILRPCTPLTPASAEVANICKPSRPTSSASLHSQGNASPLQNPISNWQVNENTLKNFETTPKIEGSLCGGVVSNFNNEEIEYDPKQTMISNPNEKLLHQEPEHDYSKQVLILTSNEDKHYHPEKNANETIEQEIPLSDDMDIKESRLSPTSTGKLYSAYSSPVRVASPMKDDSSEDYASASENVEEIEQQTSNTNWNYQYLIPPTSPNETDDNVPDSWENLELDDTPLKAGNFLVDFSQPLDFIMKNWEKQSTLNPKNIETSGDSQVEFKMSPLMEIQAPLSKNDIFIPDSTESERKVSPLSEIQVPPTWKDVFSPDSINNSEAERQASPPLNIQAPMNWKDPFNPDSISNSEAERQASPPLNIHAPLTLKDVANPEPINNSEIKCQASPPLKIQVPMNWKDGFNPDAIKTSQIERQASPPLNIQASLNCNDVSNPDSINNSENERQASALMNVQVPLKKEEVFNPDLINNSKVERQASPLLKIQVPLNWKDAFNPDSFNKSEIERQASPPLNIQVPLNWKDIFNPDSMNNSERVENNNKIERKSPNSENVKRKSPNSEKFNVKRVPLQIIELCGKSIHLLYLKDVPSVIELEFFKQFVPFTPPMVLEKVVEVYIDPSYLKKAEYPAILAELDKLPEFFGGVQKSHVIRLNRVRIINLRDIPMCLQILNVPNKRLLEDLKKIENELQSC